MTYAELKTTIADWLNRSDLDSVIPTFISLAEAELERKLRMREMEAQTTLAVSASPVELPADFLQFRVVVLDTGSRRVQLDVLSAEQFADFAAAHNPSGTPCVVAVIGNALHLAPAPDAEYNLEMVYYRKLARLSDQNPSNWLLESHPDAYLYGALQHSAPFLRDDDRLPVWAAKFANVVRELGGADERALFGNAKLRAACGAVRW